MAVSAQLLSDLGALEGPIGGVNYAVNDLIYASRTPGYDLSVSAGLNAIDGAVQTWLKVSADLELRLLEHGRQRVEDLYDVQSRLGGLAMLHLAMASDIALLAPFDDAPQDGRPADTRADLPERATTLGDASFGNGNLLQALREPLDEAGGGEVAELAGDPSGTGEDVAVSADTSVVSEDAGVIIDDVVDDVVTDIVTRAGRSATAVLVGLAGGTGLFAELMPHLSDAVNAWPDDIQSTIVAAAKRVAKLVRTLVARVNTVMNSVLGGYRAAVLAILGTADPASSVAESLAGRVVGRVLKSKTVRVTARAQLIGAKDRSRRIKRIRALKKLHQRWVGPVRVVAKGLPHLWAVPTGPLLVPAAPVGAVALLGWTVLITGDQLDAPGPFPNIWKGVIRRASGE